MLDPDTTTGCDVLILPERGGGRSISTARSNIALAEAVRFVVEDLAFDTRERAVIRTPRRNIFANEAAVLHALFSGRRRAEGGGTPPDAGSLTRAWPAGPRHGSHPVGLLNACGRKRPCVRTRIPTELSDGLNVPAA